jgi:hypothetical protein
MEEIKNKVKESGLVQIDLADFKPTTEIIEIDLASQLWQGFVLREKDFRTWIQTEDWSKYAKKAVYIHCSADAIVPTWAYMLVASALVNFTNQVIVGSKLELEKELISKKIQQLNHLFLKNKIRQHIKKNQFLKKFVLNFLTNQVKIF